MGNTAEISLYCRKCFYDLRGIGTPSRCPECGGPFDLSNPKTFRTRRPRGIWRRLRWVIYPLLLIALASAGGIGWLWLGWHREQPAINWVRSRLSSPVKTEVLGPLWLQRKLGRWGDRLERVYAIDAVWLNPGTSAKECPLWRLSRLREITLMGSGVHDEWTSLLATQQRLEVVRLPLGSVTNDGVAALV